jgi:hypothetical protein
MTLAGTLVVTLDSIPTSPVVIGSADSFTGRFDSIQVSGSAAPSGCSPTVEQQGRQLTVLFTACQSSFPPGAIAGVVIAAAAAVASISVAGYFIKKKKFSKASAQVRNRMAQHDSSAPALHQRENGADIASKSQEMSNWRKSTVPTEASNLRDV